MIYFISDLHLDESRPAVTRAFFEFLDTRVKGADALYILGDFFEVWVGDDDDATFARQIVERLRRFRDSGTPIYFMHGNRDFLVGEQFARATGATLLSDPTVIDLYGKPLLLMHGDSLCTRDREYMAFRQQARSAEWQQALLAQPLEARRALAKKLREQSKSMNSLKAEDIMDVTPKEVVGEMTKHGVKTLIHGHTHRPARHTVDLKGQCGERFVLGDWGESLWWIEASTDGGLALRHATIEPMD